jgi:4-alpha-glucanotransferase
MDERVRKEDVDSERINIPAIPNHYWRYRMHLTVEQLLNEEGVNSLIRSMIATSGR